jgi:hypothetical protein
METGGLCHRFLVMLLSSLLGLSIDSARSRSKSSLDTSRTVYFFAVLRPFRYFLKLLTPFSLLPTHIQTSLHFYLHYICNLPISGPNQDTGSEFPYRQRQLMHWHQRILPEVSRSLRFWIQGNNVRSAANWRRSIEFAIFGAFSLGFMVGGHNAPSASRWQQIVKTLEERYGGFVSMSPKARPMSVREALLNIVKLYRVSSQLRGAGTRSTSQGRRTSPCRGQDGKKQFHGLIEW